MPNGNGTNNVARLEVARQRASTSRIPPYDRMAEAAVLEAVLMDGATALDTVSDKLKPQHFFVEAYRRIYEAACFLRQNGTDIDVVTVAGRLRDTNRLEQIGGSAALAELRDSTPSTAHIEAHARIIRDKARIRSLIWRCEQLAAEGYAEADAASYGEQVRSELDEILRDSADDGGRMIGHDIDAVYQRMIGKTGAIGAGVPSGFAQLDEFTAGLQAGEVTYVAGRPGMGKTSFALCIARNIAYLGWYDHPEALTNVVAFYSIEQPREQILIRLACIDGGIDNQRLRKQQLTDIEWRDLCNACARLRSLQIFVDDKPLDLQRVRASLFRLRSEAKAVGKKLIAAFIDYLQLMKGDGDNENERISKNSAGLKELSKELNIPIVALCQLNRDVEKQQDKRPGLPDLRGSGSIEQDGDNIIFIYRDDYYQQDRHKEPDGDAELIIAKQRNGPAPRTAVVRFYAGCTRFENA